MRKTDIRWDNLKSQETNYERQTSEAIDLLRFPLAMMVVFIHSQGPNGHPNDYTHLTGMDITNLIRTLGTEVFPHIAVPAFFLISGYFLFKHLETWDWQVWKDKLKNRLHTLMLPYIIWCLIYVLWTKYLKVIVLRLGAFVIKGKPLDDIVEYLNTVDINWPHVFWDSFSWMGGANWLGVDIVNTSPELIPFWFIRDLIVVVLLSPLIYYLVKTFGLWFVGLIGLFLVSGIWPDIHGLGSTAVFYFSLGAWFTVKGHDLCSSLYNYRWLFYTPYLFLLPVMVYFDGQHTYGGKDIFILFGTLSSFCISYYLVKQRGMHKNLFLVKSCFFVFAFHYFILVDCGHLIRGVIGLFSPLQISICYVLQPLLTITICLIAYYVFHRFFPRICKLMTGR